MDIETTITNISKETLEEVSKFNNEPEWLLERRKLFFEKFESTPNPTSRRMDYKNLNLDNYFYDVNEDDSGDVEYKSRFASKSLSFDISIGEKNSISAIDHREAVIHLDDEFRSKGVILKTLRNSISEHGDLLNKYFLEIHDQQSSGKFNLLNSALWQNGTFIYVPKNVEVNIPLTNLHIISKKNNIYLPFVLMVTESGSKVTLIDYHASDSSDMNAFVSSSVEIIVGQNAKVDYIIIQEYGANVN
jgi:Fe-S cluster assembly protein SufD